MIAKSISTATKRTRTELEDATEQLTEASLIIYTTVNELREEHHSIIVELKGALEAAEIAGAVGKEGQKRGYTRTNADGIEESTETYAERTRRFIPTPHAQVVAKAELQKRRVQMTRAAGMEGDRTNELSKKQLVEKANMAIELMDIPASTKPEEARFVGANKMNGQASGDIIYEMNLSVAAEWIKEKEVMTLFIGEMGSTVDFRAQTFEVVFDWVPTSFKLEHKETWASVELASGIRGTAIHEARWIKPLHMRSPGQRIAIMILGFAMQENANTAINAGLFVEGKKVWGRKQTQEPRRCLKCQCFGTHKASQCAAIHETCGRCAKQHKTNSCPVTLQSEMECSNCRGNKEEQSTGHGAADRRCPI
ncbi:hypothetical protein BYT27DRAFT_7100428, partial [Phlegmacium glaucopus]